MVHAGEVPIKLNVTGGGTAFFPEADCTRPIFSGEAIADLTGGNMQGSCKPPTAPDGVVLRPAP